MESRILTNLNDEQREPARQVNGAVLVTAGAGSGKTRMLTHRIAYMVDELDISPNNILAITFTNKAANEMKERLEKMISDIGDMWVCTFHAMCSKILRYNIDLLGYTKSFSIYGDAETDSRAGTGGCEGRNTKGADTGRGSDRRRKTAHPAVL